MEHKENRLPNEVELLWLDRKGFKWQGMTATRYHVTGDWLFQKGNNVYDLSAADLTKIDAIESKGLFIVSGKAY